MNIKDLKQIIFKPASNIMKKSGEEIFCAGLVSGIRGKKIENTYHIYGDVVNNINHNILMTHIKINLSDKRVEQVSCLCDDFKELSKEKSLFMCQHLTATAYKFLAYLDNKEDAKRSPRVEKEKTEVGLDVKIAHKSWKGEIYYELEFRIGGNNKYLVADLREFISLLDQNKTIYVNNQFSYNPEENIISPGNIGLINFIRKCINSKNEISPSGRNIIIKPEDLRRFLNYVHGDKVTFKYNAIEYKTLVLKDNLPLYFTLKEKNQCFVLTTHKNLPVPLNENRDVYLFNSNLYLPSKNQIKKYSPLYDKFQEKGQIQYDRTIENYNNIIALLAGISKNINATEEIKNFAADSANFQFLIYKKEEHIYCDVYAIYFNVKINILSDVNEKIQFIRDLKKEEKVLMKLEHYNFIKRKNNLIFNGSDEDLFNLLNKRESILHSLGTVIFGKGIGNLKIYDSASIKVDLCEEDVYFKFNYNIDDIDFNEFNHIFESYKSGARFYKTKDNCFLDFEDAGVVSFLNLLELLNSEEKMKDGSLKIQKNKALYISEVLKNRDYKLGRGVELLEDIENKLVQLNRNGITLPENLKAKLREYQINGFKWFKTLSELDFGGILADEMGLGKTVQTIAFLLSEQNKKSIIITPTSLIYNWKDEIEKFAPTLKVFIAHGDKVKKQIIDNLEQYDVILTTYGTLRNNIDRYRDIEFYYCIIDEAQNIKNPAAEVTKVVKEIQARVRFALTGTPLENNLTELWSLFDFIMPGYLYSKEIFDKKFGANGDSKLEDLRLLIKPFILRRTKKEVMKELPDKIEHTMLVQMTASQKSIYNNYIKDIRSKIKNNSKGDIQVFSYLTKLRQICLDPSLVLEDYKGGSGKLEVVTELVEECIDNGGKLLLFSQFTSALKKIGETLEERKIEFFSLDGATPPKERIRLVNEFNNSDKVKVFLISLKAGGTGLNLTSANLVIHFDPWWNPAVEDQATDRAHRIGQRNVVEVIKLVAKGTIEEKIISLQENKKELIDNVITGELKDSNMLHKLSMEELMKLFPTI